MKRRNFVFGVVASALAAIGVVKSPPAGAEIEETKLVSGGPVPLGPDPEFLVKNLKSAIYEQMSDRFAFHHREVDRMTLRQVQVLLDS